MIKYWLITILFSSMAYGTDSFSDSLEYAQVTYVKASQTSNGSWCFDTQVRHNDEGWQHYADTWQVVSQQGEVLGERVLFHPHDNEQPFTRSLCGVQIPSDVTMVIVRAKCNLHGFGGQTVVIDLGSSKGDKYSVTR
ncbi:hypothetical protein MUS1_13720 [Marinomonas ushuaiensis DSM 15871]|uniref:Uncharacterized protein n=1 Tax=Marinomonas ushuaiensis DSM 15871 TaxID=1122207 RepID=X7E3V5_9GAMM|nr:hypothetical protein [Marinomonas ushuaiensis]ETX10637.1 hypothetical protein MUS1_13720 [Marinomonas ushuaiensis DSM 15871]